LRLDVGDVGSVFSDDEQVVNPNGDVEVSFDVDAEAGVGTGSDETDFDEEGVDFEVPDASSLLEAIEGVQ
jgi:hypothetical protein